MHTDAGDVLYEVPVRHLCDLVCGQAGVLQDDLPVRREHEVICLDVMRSCQLSEHMPFTE